MQIGGGASFTTWPSRWLYRAGWPASLGAAWAPSRRRGVSVWRRRCRLAGTAFESRRYCPSVALTTGRRAIHALSLLRRLRRAYRDFAHFYGLTSVVHANWIQNALPLKGTNLPALITVLGSDLALLRLPGMVAMVRAMLRGRAAILAPNADWMVPVLEKSFGDLAEVRTIPFGVHGRWFAVERQPEAIGGGDWLMVSRVTRAKLGHLLDWGEGLFGHKSASCICWGRCRITSNCRTGSNVMARRTLRNWLPNGSRACRGSSL